MTEKECLAAGIAVSLFAHFALLIAPRPPEPEPSFTTVVQMDMASPAVATSREKGIGIAAASPPDMDKADAADRKRQAFLRYLDDIDEAGVSMTPGHVFGTMGDGFVRVSYANSMENLQRAVILMREVLEKRAAR